jgi:hypothetical protein
MEDAEPPRALARWGRRLWWLHSAWALAFGVGVMLLSRRGLAYVDKVLLVALAAWLLVFGGEPAEEERLARRGLRVATNYVIKNLYQQMFFFQLPLYASSATWALDSPNMWLPILLGGCAVVSTMDLVFDNVVMRKRWLAALLYGVCVFALLNLALPLLLPMPHASALLVAALAAPPATALLTFGLRRVLAPFGLLITIAVSAGVGAGAIYGRAFVPPAPLAMAAGAVGHGTPGQYEVMPGRKTVLRADALGELRCVTQLVEPGGFRDEIVHIWRHEGRVLAALVPEEVATDEPGAIVLRSRLPALPAESLGSWSCVVATGDGQLVGRVAWRVIR